MSILSPKDLYGKKGNIRILCFISELNDQGKIYSPVFTIHEEKEGLISLKKLFVKYTKDDPSETTFALEVYGDMGYWIKAREHPALKPHVENWRKEADAFRKAKAFSAVVKEVEKGGRNSFSAAKFLIEEPWKKGKVGRKQAKESAEEAYQSSSVREDISRLKELGLIN